MRIWRAVLGGQHRPSPCPLSDGPQTLLLIYGDHRRPPKRLLEQLRRTHPKAYLAGASVAGHIPEAIHAHETHVVGVQLDHGYWSLETSLDATTGGAPDTAGLTARVMDRDPKGLYYLAAPFVASLGDRAAHGIQAMTGGRVPTCGCVASDSQALPERGWILDRDGIHSMGLLVIGVHGNVRVRAASRAGYVYSPTERPLLAEGCFSGVVQRLGGKPALETLLRQLGALQSDPDTWRDLALRHPWGIGPVLQGEPHLLRTVVDIDRRNQALLFGGHVPEGALVRLTRGRTSDLVRAVATLCREVTRGTQAPGLLLMAACAARIGLPVTYPLPRGSEVVGFYGTGELGLRGSRLQHLNHHVSGLWIEE